MFNFGLIKAASMLRAARTAFMAADYSGAALIGADVLTALWFTQQADEVRAEVKAIGDGSAEEISKATLAIVLDLLNTVFHFGTPLLMGASPDHKGIPTQLELFAQRCDEEAAKPVKFSATGPDAKAIDPALILTIFSIIQSLFTTWRNRKNIHL